MKNDKNTKYFHSIVKKRRTGNSIPILKLQDGNMTSDHELIQNEFIEYYSNMFGSSTQTDPAKFDVLQEGPMLDNEDCNTLLQWVTIDEIKAALNDIGDDKAPGPDGYSSTFFKSTWAITGPDLCAAVLEFFESRRLLKQLNHTIIALIPKTTFEPLVITCL